LRIYGCVPVCGVRQLASEKLIPPQMASLSAAAASAVAASAEDADDKSTCIT